MGVFVYTAPEVPGGPVTRAEKIQQLRADHQRRHQERSGQYPHDDREEEYERQIQEIEKQVHTGLTHCFGNGAEALWIAKLTGIVGIIFM